MVLESLLNPVFSPLLELSPFWAIALISVVLTFLITLIYKLVTDQVKMKSLKEELKSVQKEMKNYKDDPKKMLEIQKSAMHKNMEYMKHSFKPMIFTMIPILLIFGWLNAHLAYEPILPGQEFSVTALFNDDFSGNATLVNDKLEFLSPNSVIIKDNSATWKLKGPAGDHLLELNYGQSSQVKELLITEQRNYAKIVETYKDPNLKSITINNQKLKVNMFGLKLGWIWAYIIISIVASIIIRKLMKVY